MSDTPMDIPKIAAADFEPVRADRRYRPPPTGPIGAFRRLEQRLPYQKPRGCVSDPFHAKSVYVAYAYSVRELSAQSFKPISNRELQSFAARCEARGGGSVAGGRMVWIADNPHRRLPRAKPLHPSPVDTSDRHFVSKSRDRLSREEQKLSP